MTRDRPQEPAILVRGLRKSYRQLHVLRGVDLDVPQGGVLALLGSNGAPSRRRWSTTWAG